MHDVAPVTLPLRTRIARRVRARLRDIRVLRDLVIRWRHRDVDPEDAFLVGYPKAGNTWLGGLLVHLATGREFSFDEKDEVTPGIGDHRHRKPILPGGGRLIKSHEPYLPTYGSKYGRVVYVVRDGRDIVVSYYYHQLRIGAEPGSMSRFLERFLAGSIDGWGPWPAHVRSWLDSPQARDGRLLVIRYEDLLDHPEDTLAAAARFLRLPSDPAAIRAALDLHTPDRMRERELQTDFHRQQARHDITFVRRATRGEHAEVLSPEQLRRFDEVAGPVLARLGYDTGAPSPRAALEPSSSRS